MQRLPHKSQIVFIITFSCLSIAEVITVFLPNTLGDQVFILDDSHLFEKRNQQNYYLLNSWEQQKKSTKCAFFSLVRMENNLCIGRILCILNANTNECEITVHRENIVCLIRFILRTLSK